MCLGCPFALDIRFLGFFEKIKFEIMHSLVPNFFFLNEKNGLFTEKYGILRKIFSTRF